MRSRSFPAWRWSNALLAAALLAQAGCKTLAGSGESGIAAQVNAAPDFELGDDIPALRQKDLTPGMLQKLVAVARKDAEAMFGGKSRLQVIAFDNSMADGPCAGFIGVRVLFANPDPRAEVHRAFAMYTLNPGSNDAVKCFNSVEAGLKTAADVRTLVAGGQPLDSLRGGVAAVKLSIDSAVLKIRERFPTFEVARMITITQPADIVMKGSPWAVVYGFSCGEDGVAYVNLADGKVIEATRPFNTSCQ